MENIKISIVIVTFNAENVIRKTINSIITQDYTNKELIFIDGASEDNTKEIINEYSDFISYFKSESDLGIYDAMNKGLKISTGNFLIFMNAGDSFVSNVVITNVVKSISNLNSIYYGNALYFTNECNGFIKRGGRFNRFRIAQSNICHQTIFYPYSYYKSVSFNLRYRLLADWEYNMIAFRKKNSFIYLDIDVANYDNTGVSITHRDSEFEKDVKKIVYENLGILPIIYLSIRKLKFIFEKYIWKL